MKLRGISNGGLSSRSLETEEQINNIVENKGKRVLVVDVDGTLRCGKHRLHLLPSEEELASYGELKGNAFTKFNMQCHNDTPITGVIRVVISLINSGDYYVVVLTACSFSYHTGRVLHDQLTSWGIRADLILMRHEGNHQHAVEFKEGFLKSSGLLDSDQDVTLIDDNPDICNMARGHGLLALQCEDWGRFSKKDKPPLGVPPKFIHTASRMKELYDGIARYKSAGITPDEDWISELQQLQSELH